jgi:hypothetical protein
VDAETQLPENEQAPALSDDPERVRDGADPGSPQIRRFAFLTHLAMITLVSKFRNRTDSVLGDRTR